MSSADVGRLAVEIRQNVVEVVLHAGVIVGQVYRHVTAVVVQERVGTVGKQCVNGLAGTPLNSWKYLKFLKYGNVQ